MESLWSQLMPASPNDVVVYLAASVGFKMVVCWLRGSAPPTSARCVGHVTAVKLYPVKSLGGLALSAAECTRVGLKAPGLRLFDRYSTTTLDEAKFHASSFLVTSSEHPRNTSDALNILVTC